MVGVLLKIIFYTISLVSNVITKVIFNTTACFLVLLIHAFKVPGEATKGILEKAAEAMRTVVEYTVELAAEVVAAVAAAVVDLIKEGIFGSIGTTSEAVGGMVEKTRASLEWVVEELPEIIEGVSEMVSKMVSDVWNNCLDAIGYVKENA